MFEAPAADVPGMLPEFEPVAATLHGERWSLLLSRELLPAACDAAGVVRPRLVAALEAELAGVRTASRWRATIDSGDALWGAVFERSFARIRLGSPSFAVERATARLVETLPFAHQRQEGDRIMAWTAHGDAWRMIGADAAPLEIEASLARNGLFDLLATDGPAADSLRRVWAQARTLAEAVAAEMPRYKPGLLERLSQWGLGLQADHPVLRVHALRLIAALPSLDHDRGGREVDRLVTEMLRRTKADHQRAVAASSPLALPTWMARGLALASLCVAVLPAAFVAWLTRASVRKVAGIFIAGESVARAEPALRALLSSGRSATLDQLGELVITEAEADHYRDAVLQLIEGAASLHRGQRNAAGLPLAHVSVKSSALTAHYDADDVEGAAGRVVPRLGAILRRARDLGVFVNIDAEHESVRDLTLTMLDRTLASDPGLWSHPDVGIVVQAYRRDAPEHLADVIALARRRGVRMPIRLVKGAYWDAETTEADANHHDAPQWLDKRETDLCFQALVLRCLEHGDELQLALGSHNLRDHCFARAARAELYPDAPPIEHQCLHATYEGLSTAMAAAGWPVRNYIPVGSLLMGMAYLVRRVMENSSQVGVLTMARRAVDLGTAMTSPAQSLLAKAEQGRPSGREGVQRRPLLTDQDDDLRFRPVSPARLHLASHRQALDEAIEAVRGQLPLRSHVAATGAGAPLRSFSPDAPAVEIGALPTATTADVAEAVARASEAAQAWAALPAAARALHLLRAGEWLRARRPALAALVCLEAGKARREALADIDEAVDFCRFYALQSVTAPLAGEARGVIAVVAPWNFPVAIPCGMTVAALAAGNAALLKGAEQTPLCADIVVQALRAAGVPADLVAHVAGDGPTTGAALVGDERVDGVVFTGSVAVGTRLYAQMAARRTRDGRGERMAITEMGGKNAVIITANADLDEAVAGCLRAAFGHSGQKCSALSRILVDARVADAFAERFAAAAASLQVGRATAHGTQINPVVSAEDLERLRTTADAVCAEAEAAGGRVLLQPEQVADADGALLIGPTVVQLPASAAMRPESWAAREIFGPIVHCIAYQTLAEALSLQAGLDYALTVGVYAQSEDDVDAVIAGARAGNVYVNRPITGARVGIEPFGGFALSGTGPKAGGVDYLAAFRVADAPAPTGSQPEALAPPTPPSPAEFASPPAPASATATAPTRRSLHGRGTRVAAPVHGVDEAAAALLATIPLLGEVAGPVVAEAKRQLARRRSTHAIPGQRTEDHTRRGRGMMLVISHRPSPSPAAIEAVAAALAVGNQIWFVGAAATHWQALADRGLAVVVDTDAAVGTWYAAVTDPEVATVFLDGADAPGWAAWLQAALAARPVARCLPQILRPLAPCGADAAVARQLLVSTIAVNTLRHGAPLVLDLPEADGVT